MSYLAVDTGGTFMKYGIIDEDGGIITKDKQQTPQKDFQEWLKGVVQLTNRYSENRTLQGIALSCPGAVNNADGTIKGFSAVPYLHGPNIRDHLQAATGLRIAMENDANCAAVAECWKGIAKHIKDVVFVVIGTGIGGAIIKEGQLHTGAHLCGGEFGYMLIEEEGTDGRYKSWSEIASANALAKQVKPRDGRYLTGEEIFKHAQENNDKECQTAMGVWLKALAKGIYNIQYIYDPEMIVIGGGMSTQPNLKNYITNSIEDILKTVKTASIRPRVECCSFSNDANLIGAAKIFKETFER